MNEKIKENDVLLVKEPEAQKLKVVAGTHEDGSIKTVTPDKANEPDFMKIDKHSNVLENFFANFLRQYKNPTHFSFFRGSAENIESNATVLEGMLKNPEQEMNRQALDSVRINPQEFAQAPQEKQGYAPIDPERIDWAQLESIGVTRESLEKSKAMDAILNYRKSPSLVPLTLKIGDMTIRTEARLSLKEIEDGRIVPSIHAIQKEPQLDRPFYGHTFTDEDKKALLATGNLGHLIDLKIPGKEDVRAFVSIDKLTNDIVALDARKLRIPDQVKGVTLSPQQKSELSEGKAIFVEGMTAKTGKNFSATLQLNADKRGIEFQFGNSLKESQKEHQQPRQTQHTQAEQTAKVLRVPDKMLGREVSPEEQNRLKAGETVYMTGLLDKAGQPFNAYVKPNFEQNKFDFLKWNPDKSKSKEVTPDNASKTQVAVNSEGKTNEATKNVKEPLTQGQSEPTAQQEQQEQRRKGIKM